jgi:SAM-dependent methyltransferase
MKKNYWIKKNGENGEIIWRPGRSLGLEGAKGRIGNLVIPIKNLLKKKKKIRILEVGTGFGRALLELKQLFGDKIEVFGTNHENDWNQKLTNEYALDQGFLKNKIPKIYTKFDGGKKFHFKSSSFDFIFCQATMQYIRDRALFIEEINRILTKEGLAILELQEFRADHPKKYQEMIEILKNKKKINFLKYLKQFKNIKIKKSTGRSWHYIIMKKLDNFNLNLKIKKVINLENISSKYWGVKLIYNLK